MKHKKQFLLVTLLALSTWLAVTPVTHAQEMVDEVETTQSTAEVMTDDSDVRRRAQDKASAAREKAKQRVESKKADVQDKLAGRRLDICNERKDVVNSRITARSQALQARIERIRVLQEKVQAYAAENTVTLADAQTLDSIADAAYEKAIEDVAMAASFTLECAAQNANGQIGSDITSSFKTAHQSVKAYKSAVKAIFQATKDGKQSDEE